MEEHFQIGEFERQEVKVVSRKTGIPIAKAVSGVMYGDGGAYIECERTDLTPHVCEIKVKGRYEFEIKRYEKSTKRLRRI